MSAPPVSFAVNSPLAAHSSSGVAPSSSRSRTARWSGGVMSGLALLFLAFDAGIKLVMAPQAIEATGQLGYPSSVVVPLGVIELVLLVLYVVPRTALVGVVLWTGYLGGAIATHVRLENPLFTHVLFPVYIAALLWGALWLRDPRTRVLLAPSRPNRPE